MSDQPKEVVKEVVKETAKEVVKEVVKNEEDCLFVTENDKFDIVVKYNDNGDGKIIVENVDESFIESDKTKKLTVTLKYPSQGDSDAISRAITKGKNMTDYDIKDFLGLEVVRFMVLARGWSIKKDLNTENIMLLNPRIIKAMVLNVREKIGMDGII